MHNIHSHEGYPKFIFKWLHSEDLKSFDTFLKDLEPFNNYFVVLDDASFVADAEGVSKNQMAKIGMELTRVRHRLQGGRMIVCIINHALTSVQKSVFRNTTFTIATSMVSNARKGLEDLFGNRYMINGFAKHYRTQVLDHKVSIPISSYEKKYLNLDTKKVRIGLIQEVNWLHYFIWEDVSCEICNQDYYQEKDSKYKSPLTPAHFLAEVNKDTIRKQKKKKKTKKEKLDSLEWNVPTDFIVGFGKEVRGEQSKFWGNIKGSKDQLARGYRRIQL